MTAPDMGRVHRLLAIAHSQELSIDAKIAEIQRADPTPAELATVAEMLRVEGHELLAELPTATGLSSLVWSMSLKEITCVAAISGLLRPWFPVDVGNHMERELGAMVKIVPPETAAEIEKWIKWAGLADAS